MKFIIFKITLWVYVCMNDQLEKILVIWHFQNNPQHFSVF